MTTNYDIRCWWNGPDCAGKVAEVQYEDDRPYPGDQSFGMVCERCYPSYLTSQQESFAQADM